MLKSITSPKILLRTLRWWGFETTSYMLCLLSMIYRTHWSVNLANPWPHLVCWSLRSLIYVMQCYTVDLLCVHISFVTLGLLLGHYFMEDHLLYAFYPTITFILGLLYVLQAKIGTPPTYLSLIEDRKIERLKNDFIARGERKKSCVKWWLKATKYYESLYVTLIHVVNQIWIPNMVIRTCIQNNFNAGYFLRNWLTMNLLSTTKVIFLSP